MIPILEQILDLINRSGSLTSHQLAKRLGIREATVREHFMDLRDKGLIKTTKTAEARIMPACGDSQKANQPSK